MRITGHRGLLPAFTRSAFFGKRTSHRSLRQSGPPARRPDAGPRRSHPRGSVPLHAFEALLVRKGIAAVPQLRRPNENRLAARSEREVAVRTRELNDAAQGAVTGAERGGDPQSVPSIVQD